LITAIVLLLLFRGAIWTFSRDIIWPLFKLEETKNILTFIAILVALFGPFLVAEIINRSKKRKVTDIVHKHLSELLQLLNRTENELKERASEIKDETIVPFDETRMTEIDGFHFIFDDLLLPRFHELDLHLHPKTIDFFITYRVNIRTLKKRAENDQGKIPALRYRTFSRLKNSLTDAIKEWS
jgi:hypothetical protein